MSFDEHNNDAQDRMEIIGRLLESLLPRAADFCFYDRSGKCTWTRSGQENGDADGFVQGLDFESLHADASARKPIKQTLQSGRKFVAVFVIDAGSSMIGLLAAAFSRNVGQGSTFDPAAVQAAIGPVAAILAELSSAAEGLSEAQSARRRAEKELSLVYSVDQKIHAPSRRYTGLAELVGRSGRFLGVAYSVLLIPSKRIRISATHSSWKAVNRRAVDKYVIETMMPQLQGKTGPVAYNVNAIDGSDQPADKGYQALLSPLLDASGNVEGAVAQFDRVSGEPFAESNKRFMANIVRKIEYVIEQSFDTMTGLMNRAGFEAQLSESLASLSTVDECHQLIYFDLDNLQLVNDTFGQEAGDQVIRRFAAVLESVLPRNAVASRLTGDDFAILINGATTDAAHEIARDVRARSDQLRYLQGSNSLQVTVSIGIATISIGDEPGDVLTAARIACDKAKDYGRDRIEIHDAGDQSIIRRYDDMHLVTRIQRALDNNEFILMVQPIVAADQPGQTAKYEVLIRMPDGGGSDISPGSLISAAERYHLMPNIDRWVISATVRAISSASKQIAARNLSFAVNLSGQSIGDDEMLDFIEQEIDSADLPAASLSFEITESAAVGNLKKAQAFIQRLRARGCEFSLDDFGAGLSSFAYLKSLEVDTLKIDGGFIKDIARDRISRSMVAAITQVAEVMNLKTVAEYVGNAEAQAILTSMGVTFLQGHGVGRPVRLDALLKELGVKRRSA